MRNIPRNQIDQNHFFRSACCVMNGTRYEPNMLMTTQYDDNNGCNLVSFFISLFRFTSVDISTLSDITTYCVKF